MSLVPASFGPLLHLGASPSALAIGFAVLLVLSLVTAEELDMRRNRPTGTATEG